MYLLKAIDCSRKRGITADCCGWRRARSARCAVHRHPPADASMLGRIIDERQGAHSPPPMSRLPSTGQESMVIVRLEAWAAGTPDRFSDSMATAAAPPREQGLRCRRATSKALADAIAKLIADPELRARVERSARPARSNSAGKTSAKFEVLLHSSSPRRCPGPAAAHSVPLCPRVPPRLRPSGPIRPAAVGPAVVRSSRSARFVSLLTSAPLGTASPPCPRRVGCDKASIAPSPPAAAHRWRQAAAACLVELRTGSEL